MTDNATTDNEKLDGRTRSMQKTDKLTTDDKKRNRRTNQSIKTRMTQKENRV